MISFSWLALSVTFGATSPKGRGLGKKMKFAWTAKRLSLWESWRVSA